MTIESTPSPPRCLKCFYILEHLESHVCPECGSPFDLNNSSTYTRKPPFVWWTYWMPAFLLAAVGGGILWLTLIQAAGFGCASTLVVPLCIGIVVGYGVKIRPALAMVLGVFAALFAIGGLASAGLVGGFCGIILAVIAMVPVLAGVLAGLMLRAVMAQSKFSQASYLRSLLLHVSLVLLPVTVAFIQGRHPVLPTVIVTTTQTINAPPMAAWYGIQFFEEVRRPTPWLLRLSPSLRPMYTIGHSEKVGDLKTCIYRRGKLIKQITEVDPGKRLAFKVVDQEHIENDSAVLLARLFHAADVMRAEGGRRLVRARQCINSPSVRKAPPYPHSNAVVFGIELGGVRRCWETGRVWRRSIGTVAAAGNRWPGEARSSGPSV